MNWYIKALKQYASFGGRAQRMEYWCFVLINILIGFVLVYADAFMGTLDTEVGIGLLSGLQQLLILLPTIAVTVRRLHDIGKSAWWLFLIIVPFIGPIILLVFTFLDSQSDENEYGPNPKAA
jgi:uncharacterized membrane protein YhaH (DUF805 family)